MNYILFIQETQDSEELDCEVSNVGESCGLADITVVIVGVERCGAQVLKY